MESSEIIRSFCEKIGIGYEPDADGVCSFEADGLLVSIHDLRELDTIALVGDLGEPPPERLELLYKTMLESNHLFGGTGGATLSLDPATGYFALCLAMPCRALDADSFYAATERFVSTMETWKKLVGDFRSVLPPLAETEAEMPRGLSDAGFMQV